MTARGRRSARPSRSSGSFDSWPRAVAFGERWLVIWEGHNNHDDSPGTIRASFVAPDGTATAPFVVGDVGNDLEPEIAVAGDKALVVWTTAGNIYGRRLNADGTSPEPASGAPVADAAGRQASPRSPGTATSTSSSGRTTAANSFRSSRDGDVFGARVAPTNVKLEEFAVADSELPETTPFVIASDGLTLFSYAKFYDGSDAGIPDYAAHRVTLRTSRLPAPENAGLPAAPSGLVAHQLNSGPATGNVTLSWADNSTNETGFKVESATTGAFSQIALLGANSTTTGGIFGGANNVNHVSASAPTTPRATPNTRTSPRRPSRA